MKKVLVMSMVLILVTSCQSEQSESKKETFIQPKDTSAKRSLIIGDPLDCGLEGILMFPIGTSYHPQVYEPPPEKIKMSKGAEGLEVTDYQDYTYSFSVSDDEGLTFAANSGTAYDKLALTEYINSNTEDFDINNILFYDLETGRSYPLIQDDTLHIISFAIHKEFDNDLIFYRVVKHDYNSDEKYNGMDPVMLYVSDLGGEQMIQVTPDNQQFVDYEYYRENQKILAKLRIDADLDTMFTPADETNFVELNLNNPEFGKSLFTDSVKNVLKSQLNI